VKFDPLRFSLYAQDLAESIMKFRITEDTFFQHQERKVGEVMEGLVGPYRHVVGAGGMKRIAQFEVIEEPSAMADGAAADANFGGGQQSAAGSLTTVLPQNQIAPAPIAKAAPAAYPIKKTITGASALGADFKTRIAAAKSKLDAAKAQVGASLDNLDGAAARAVTVASAIQAEADDLNASIGQVSNE
jgi:hypothetical protein